MAHIFASLKESLTSVLPIALIVLILSVTCVTLDAGVLVLFLFGTILLIVGMSFFTVGSGISMEPLGDGIGKTLTKRKKLLIPLFICLVLGFLITVSEPDLQVLAEQVPTIPNALLINFVGVGVGVFLSITFVRNKKGIPLRRLLVIFYAVVILIAFFAPKEFIPTAFDSGGVTTGPITVPFIMALGAGLAASKKGKNIGEHSFGLVVLDVAAAGRVLTEILNYNTLNREGETARMQNEHHNNLIVISVNEGYSENVMQVARKAGATGGTVLKGRLANIEQFAEFVDTQVDGEREMLCILAPAKVSRQIMEDVNREFGISSSANGILFALPTEKAFKI